MPVRVGRVCGPLALVECGQVGVMQLRVSESCPHSYKGVHHVSCCPNLKLNIANAFHRRSSRQRQAPLRDRVEANDAQRARSERRQVGVVPPSVGEVVQPRGCREMQAYSVGQRAVPQNRHSARRGPRARVKGWKVFLHIPRCRWAAMDRSAGVLVSQQSRLTSSLPDPCTSRTRRAVHW